MLLEVFAMMMNNQATPLRHTERGFRVQDPDPYQQYLYVADQVALAVLRIGTPQVQANAPVGHHRLFPGIPIHRHTPAGQSRALDKQMRMQRAHWTGPDLLAWCGQITAPGQGVHIFASTGCRSPEAVWLPRRT